MENTNETGFLQPDIEAEEAMLGSLLIDPEAIHDVRLLVQPDFLYREQNGWILQAIYDLDDRREPCDLITLTTELRKKEGRLEALGGEAYIIGLINTVPTSINAKSYAMIVRNGAWRRRGITALSQIAQLMHDTELDTSDVMDQAESILFGIRDQDHGNGFVTAKQLAAEFLDEVDIAAQTPDGMIGVPWGFADLDKITGGIVDDFIVIGARPSMGKTSLLLSVAENTAVQNGGNVGFFSIEMNPLALMNRLISRRAKIDSQRIRRGQLQEHEWEGFYEAAGKISASNLFIDHGSVTVSQMRARARRWHARYGLDLIMVDYLQLMHPEIADAKLPRVAQMATITRGLKTIGAELGVPVMAASQLNRGVEQRQDKRPMLADLRDSGTIEQDADTVLFIYRDEYYEGDSTERPNIAEINVAKARNGPAGYVVDLHWSSMFATFRNLARQEIDLGEHWQSNGSPKKDGTGPLRVGTTHAAMSQPNGN